MGQVQIFEQQVSVAKTVKEIFTIASFKERFIKNYAAVTNRNDGENRLEQERWAYLQLISDKPDVQKASNMAHASALIFAATTGLSFRDNKLYVRADGKGGLKVTTSPSGKREMFLMMKEVKDVPEGVIVYGTLKNGKWVGDHFVHDKKNHLVKEHWTTEHTVEENKIENIRAAYQTIVYKDGTVKDVVVYQDDIKKAMAKSPMQGDKSTWATWCAEMAKKTAMNRAHRLYHHYPDNIVVFGDPEDKEDVVDTEHQEVDNSDDVQMTSAGEPVDTETGEITETEEATKKQEPPADKKATKNFMDE